LYGDPFVNPDTEQGVWKGGGDGAMSGFRCGSEVGPAQGVNVPGFGRTVLFRPAVDGPRRESNQSTWLTGDHHRRRGGGGGGTSFRQWPRPPKPPLLLSGGSASREGGGLSTLRASQTTKTGDAAEFHRNPGLSGSRSSGPVGHTPDPAKRRAVPRLQFDSNNLGSWRGGRANPRLDGGSARRARHFEGGRSRPRCKPPHRP